MMSRAEASSFVTFAIPVVGAPLQLTNTIASLAGQTVQDFAVLLGHGADDTVAEHACQAALQQLRELGFVGALRCIVAPHSCRLSDVANLLLANAQTRFVRVLESGWSIAPFAVEVERTLLRTHASRVSVLISGVHTATDASPFTAPNAVSIAEWKTVVRMRLGLQPIAASAFMLQRESIARGVRFPIDCDLLAPWSFELAIAYDAALAGRRLLQLGPGLMSEPAHANSRRNDTWFDIAFDHRSAMRRVAREGMLRIFRPHAPLCEDSTWFAERIRQQRLEIGRVGRVAVMRCANRDEVDRVSALLNELLALDPHVPVGDVESPLLVDWRVEWAHATRELSEHAVRLLLNERATEMV